MTKKEKTEMEPQMNADGRRSEKDKAADRDRVNLPTEAIIGSAYRVGNGFGNGFLEKVYENALAHELRKTGLAHEQQKGLEVYYDGIVVGEYFADLLVEGSVLVELKAARALDEIHMAQCMNYLKATGLKVCLLLNFGTPRVEVKRIVNNF